MWSYKLLTASKVETEQLKYFSSLRERWFLKCTGNGGRWMNLGYVLKVKLTGIADKLYVVVRTIKWSRMTPELLIWANERMIVPLTEIYWYEETGRDILMGGKKKIILYFWFPQNQSLAFWYFHIHLLKYFISWLLC